MSLTFRTNPTFSPAVYNAQAASASSQVRSVLAASAREIAGKLPMEGSTIIELSVATSHQGSSANGIMRVAAFLFEKTTNEQGKPTLKIDATYFKYGDVVGQMKEQEPLAIEEGGASSASRSGPLVAADSQEGSLVTADVQAPLAALIPKDLDSWLNSFCGDSPQAQSQYQTAIDLMKVVQKSFANGIPFPTLPLREGEELESSVKVFTFNPSAQSLSSGRLQHLNIISSSSGGGKAFQALSGDVGNYHPEREDNGGREMYVQNAERYREHLEVALGLRLPSWIQSSMDYNNRGQSATVNSMSIIGAKQEDWDQKMRRIDRIMGRVAPPALTAPNERLAIEEAQD